MNWYKLDYLAISKIKLKLGQMHVFERLSNYYNSFLLDRREKAFKARQKDLKSDQGFSDMGSFDVRC